MELPTAHCLQICCLMQLLNVFGLQFLALIELFQQIGLVSLQHSHGVQASISLTCHCVSLTHQSRRSPKRLSG